MRLKDELIKEILAIEDEGRRLRLMLELSATLTELLARMHDDRGGCRGELCEGLSCRLRRN